VNNAVSNEQVVVPVTVTGFTNIAMGTLTIEYDYTKIQFNSSASVINPALAGFAAIGDNDLPVPDGIHHRLVIAWISDPVVTLPAGSYIVKLAFKYISGSTSLQFIDISTDSKCEYNDINWDPLNDLPTSEYYIDGSVSGPAPTTKVLNINAFLEGLYNTSTGQMNKAKDYVEGIIVDKYAGSVADHITVELHDATTYSTIIYTVSEIELNQDGTATIPIPSGYTASYYVTVKQRNHIETVSSAPISFAVSPSIYSFTSSVSQAYANNQKLLSSGVYGIFAGDLNQDGFVNLLDLSSVNSAALNLLKGYSTADINGDGAINLLDLSSVNSSALNLITKKNP
jgi:hypothetical protein